MENVLFFVLLRAAYAPCVGEVLRAGAGVPSSTTTMTTTMRLILDALQESSLK